MKIDYELKEKYKKDTEVIILDNVIEIDENYKYLIGRKEKLISIIINENSPTGLNYRVGNVFLPPTRFKLAE